MKRQKKYKNLCQKLIYGMIGMCCWNACRATPLACFNELALKLSFVDCHTKSFRNKLNETHFLWE